MSKKHHHRKRRKYPIRVVPTKQSPFMEYDLQQFCFFVNRIIARIDQTVSAQVSQILRHHHVQKLEASWRNLFFLVSHIHGKANIQIRILNISKATLAQDLKRAIEFDQSSIFRKVYSEEFGMPGGKPYGVLIGDYEFSRATQDLETLRAMSEVSAAAFAPFIANASASLFGLDDFSQLGNQPNISAIFKQREYTAWHRLRLLKDIRFVGLTAPKHLLRLPYKTAQHDKYGFCLKLVERRHYLWGNVCYAFAVVLMRAFSQYGWLGNIRGQRGGFVPSALPKKEKPCRNTNTRLIETDCLITDHQENLLNALGFIPLCYAHYNNSAAFYSNNSLQKPKTYDDPMIDENAQASARLQYIFCASRFAHYIKVIGRDLIGAFQDAQACQNTLNQWLLSYTAANTDLSLEKRAKYPLQDAQVAVVKMPGKPGHFLCTMHLKPYFQLEQMATTITLVTELSPIGK